jgi:RNA polymerase sigma-70 factor, ECF subfamily
VLVTLNVGIGNLMDNQVHGCAASRQLRRRLVVGLIVIEVQQLSDEQLAAEAAREGSDGPAFVELVERFRQRVWHICFRLLGNEHDASDAAQEVFVRLFLHRAKFEGRSKYSTWVHGIAVRTCLTIRRSRGRRQRHESVASDESIEANSPGTPAPTEGLSLDLLQMLDILGEEDRALLILKYAENYSHEELAEIFGLSISACKMRISRAREKIQERFGEKAEGRKQKAEGAVRKAEGGSDNS